MTMRAVRALAFGVVVVAFMLHTSTGRAADPAPPTTATEDANAAPQSMAPGMTPSMTPGTRLESGSERRSGQTARAVGWASIAIGSEAAIVAIATSFVLLHEKNVRDSECDAARVCSQRGFDASGTMASLAVVNAAAWVVGAAGIGVGAVLLLTHRSDTRTVVAVSPTPAGIGVGLWSTF